MLGTFARGFQYTPFTPVLFAAAIVMAAIGAYAWRNRDAAGASAFAALMVATSLWAFAYGLQLAGETAATKRFWANVVHVGVAAVPVAWFAFALQFTGRDRWLTRRTLGALLLVPVVYLALVWTNEYHLLVREPIELEPVAGGSFTVYRQSFGPAFWAHAAYAYALMVAGVVLLVRLLVWSPTVYRRQAGLLVVGALVPTGTNMLHHAGFGPIPNFDLTPFSFTVAGVLFLFAIYRYRLLDLTPVARAAVVDTLREGVLVLDTDDRVVDANESARRLLELDDDAVGRPFESLLPASAEPLERSLEDPSSDRIVSFTESTEDGGNIAEELADSASVLPDDPDESAEAELAIGERPRYLHLSSTPVRDVRGDPLGRSIVVRDVTETRELQADIEASLERLRRSNAELESFAGVVSHDLREPLRTIERYLDLFESERGASLDEGDAELLAVARGNARRAQEMIEDLLAYARIGTGDVEAERVDCDRLVREVIEVLRFEIEDREATIEVADLPDVRGVEHLLRRLFQNLLSNALAYAGDEPPEIEVRASRVDGGWEFAVSDSGVGIDPDRIDDVFELFARADRGDGRDGTGMGLAICKKIVELHGGHIAIDSAPDVGTTVRFSIPETPAIEREVETPTRRPDP